MKPLAPDPRRPALERPSPPRTGPAPRPRRRKPASNPPTRCNPARARRTPLAHRLCAERRLPGVPAHAGCLGTGTAAAGLAEHRRDSRRPGRQADLELHRGARARIRSASCATHGGSPATSMPARGPRCGRRSGIDLTRKGDVDLMTQWAPGPDRTWRPSARQCPPWWVRPATRSAPALSPARPTAGATTCTRRVEPERYEQQIRLFNSIVPFRTLGVVYEDTAEGVACRAGRVQRVAGERGFRVIPCQARTSGIGGRQLNVLTC